MKIVIIIPTYNERENISRMIPLLQEEVFPRIKKHSMQILIVDDKSPDGTAEEIATFQKKWKNIVLLSGEKQGLGYAYVRGMKYAMAEMDADAVMEFDADFQHNPHDIPRLIEAMDDGAEYIIGSRYIKGGSIPKEWGLDRKILSVFGNVFTRFVWQNSTIRDMTSGFKLTRTNILKKIDLDNLLSNNFAYKMQILHDAVKAGAKIKEVPIAFLEREQGSSKISQKDQFESFYVVVRLGLYQYKRFIKFLVVGGTGFIMQFITVFVAIRLGSEQFIAAMIGGEAAILSNFVLNNLWTFGDTKSIKEQGGFLKRLVKFNVASLGAIVIQGVVVFFAVRAFGEHLYIYGYDIPISMVILVPTILLLVIPMNYFIYNKVIWKTQYLKEAKKNQLKHA